MIIISHRGNLDGPNKKNENNPLYITNALDKFFHVEIDLWVENGILFLGHDHPQYKIVLSFLKKNSSKLWIHCKNLEALNFCNKNNLHFFFHDNDEYTLTSRGYVWAHPLVKKFENTILVMPKKNFKKDLSSMNIIGLCTDYPIFYKDKFI